MFLVFDLHISQRRDSSRPSYANTCAFFARLVDFELGGWEAGHGALFVAFDLLRAWGMETCASSRPGLSGVGAWSAWLDVRFAWGVGMVTHGSINEAHYLD